MYCTGTLKVGYKRKIVSIIWEQLFLECQYLISNNSIIKEKSWIEYYVCGETRKKNITGHFNALPSNGAMYNF